MWSRRRTHRPTKRGRNPRPRTATPEESPDPAADARALAELIALVRRESFDLVHCHSTKAGAIGRIAATITRTPRLFTVHGWGFYNAEYDWLQPVVVNGERLLTRLSDEVVCVSENDLHHGRQREILGPADGTVVHNGIPPLSPDPEREPVRTAFDIDPETTVIGAVARLSEQKNPLAILRVAHRLQDRGREVTLVLIGDGPLADDCRRYAREHDVDARIPGFREDALDLLPDIDVFLLPSRFEGLPLTVLEAMHLGVPIVAYDVGGVAEAVVDGETGFVVPNGEFETFVRMVDRLVGEPNRRARFGERAKDRAASYFTAERMVAEYEELYRRFW
ncbi:glycosyltransferase family 4 protein [Haloplanus litoreus]|uniref:glycosyltransferase family 4 protein n=1 Tax=Haloplanus litoreus TaxID=767515 RepID=UPI00361E6CC6